MRKHRLQPLILLEELESLDYGWRLPLTSYHGHLYLRWNTHTHGAYVDNRVKTPYNTFNIYANERMAIDSLTNSTTPTVEHPPASQHAHKMNIDGLMNPAPQAKGNHNHLPQTTDNTHKPREYTTQELHRIHRHFSHASARKLYDLLCRSLTQTPPNTLTQLQEIVKVLRPKKLSFTFL